MDAENYMIGNRFYLEIRIFKILKTLQISTINNYQSK